MRNKEFVPWESAVCRPGDKYNRLTVIDTFVIKGTYRYFANCLCDCGNTTMVRIDKLRRQLTTSCGCYHKDVITKHGQYKNPLSKIWRAMMRRCYNPEDSHYKYYGGRGISVCSEWHNMETFIADMQDSYKKGLQIDRTNNNLGYSPENCSWATLSEQARNKRSNQNFYFQGKERTLVECSEITGINYGTLWERLFVLGWEPEKAFTTQANKKT